MVPYRNNGPYKQDKVARNYLTEVIVRGRDKTEIFTIGILPRAVAPMHVSIKSLFPSV